MENPDEMERYIKTALENENFLDYKITLTGSSGKTDGYAANIVFATVSGTTEKGPREIELVVKCSKKNFLIACKNLYKREAYLYEVILPEFVRFQVDSGIKDIFSSFPKCYRAISEKSAEILVMENLKKSGYDLYDRTKPLDINHLKLVLVEYGKLHAISFAMRDKRRTEFEKLVTDFDDVTLEILRNSFRKMLQHGMKGACDILEKSNNSRVYEKCMNIYQKGADKVFAEILETKELKSAILHGDCWSNNFLYKYESEDRRIPSKVAILDWQLSRLHSPTLDLSYFIYSTSSEEQLEHFDELLDIYYHSFSTFLKKFRCDPEKLFPYSALQMHWRKYSLFGILMATTFLHLATLDGEESFQVDESGSFSEGVLGVNVKNESRFQQRLVAIISHYFKYLDEKKID